MSGSESCRTCRSTSGGGGGSGSSSGRGSPMAWIDGGGGGKSGLGMRRAGFLGGRSGTQSSREIMGPMTIASRRSLESECFCRF